MKVDTILFDWGGTLAQTLEVWLQTFKEAYAKVNVHPSDKEISSRFGKWDAYIELGVAEKDADIYNQHLETVYEKLENVELYPGAKTILEKLKEQDYKLGLVSTSTLKMLSTALANSKIEHLFDVIISADDTDKHKPDPTPLFIAVERMGSKIENTIFVGDSDKDTGAAHNANVPLFLFSPKQHNLYYDLDSLKAEPAVKASFDTWEDFPIDQLSV
jgi:HAD superfamily hydrolase (TIGR01549 family)